MRRIIAMGVGVLILILILLGIRGCLNARKERGFENYVSDLRSIVDESNQLSADFFGRLEEPPKSLDELGIKAEIATDRGTAEGLLQRVQGLDTPDELAGAQDDLEKTFTLRRDGLAGIADEISTALGSEGRKDAIDAIVGDMKAFLASDVLFSRAQTDINQKLVAENIGEQVPVSQFLPEPVSRWLDFLTLTTTLTTFGADAGTCQGTHGVELLGATIDKTTLISGSLNNVKLGDNPPELTAQVQNGGDTQEKEVVVSYTLSGGGTSLQGEGTIGSIDAQGNSEATILFDAQPDTGIPMTLEVEVLPVPCEGLFDNNVATYTVTFE
jgi:hypothetical protein